MKNKIFGSTIIHKDGITYSATLALISLCSFECENVEKTQVETEAGYFTEKGYIEKVKPIEMEKIIMPSMLMQCWQMKINHQI